MNFKTDFVNGSLLKKKINKSVVSISRSLQFITDNVRSAWFQAVCIEFSKYLYISDTRYIKQLVNAYI